MIVSFVEFAGGSRDLALRMPWFVAAAGYVLLFIYAVPKLTTKKIETARVEGIAAKETKTAGSPDQTGEFDVEREAIAEAGIAWVIPPEAEEEG